MISFHENTGHHDFCKKQAELREQREPKGRPMIEEMLMEWKDWFGCENKVSVTQNGNIWCLWGDAEESSPYNQTGGEGDREGVGAEKGCKNRYFLMKCRSGEENLSEAMLKLYAYPYQIHGYAALMKG